MLSSSVALLLCLFDVVLHASLELMKNAWHTIDGHWGLGVWCACGLRLHGCGTGLPLDPAQCRTLAGVLERSGVQSVNELREMRWVLTGTLGIDYGLACAIAEGLDEYQFY